MDKANTFKCPKCHKEVTAIAGSVAHRCPSNKNKLTHWELQNGQG